MSKLQYGAFKPYIKPEPAPLPKLPDVHPYLVEVEANLPTIESLTKVAALAGALNLLPHNNGE